ncbi:sarcosine oxidase subunit gamma [Sneathiella limimaris]|uniref:sarcosine oxidase subunit gamma n=1 Tax=Sneathiella limimaris TaxID=1964213 RepID=UPI00146BD0BA|nr:sarcosine oxidase subunit gamma family protein [Sneathiella limimaris]
MARFDHWISPLGDLEKQLPKNLKCLSFRDQWNVRCQADTKIFSEMGKAFVGEDLPQQPNRVIESEAGVKAIWLSPDEWLIVSESDLQETVSKLLKKRTKEVFSIVDLSANRIIFELTGPDCRNILAKSSELDFHDRSFGIGNSAQTLLAKSQALVERTDADCYHIYVRNSFSRYVAEWLCDAMAEFS